jgi:hypothetical protein
VLVLEIALPATSAAGNESTKLPSADSGVTRAAVELLRRGFYIQVAGGLLSEKSGTSSNSKWVAYAPLTFTWRRKTEDHRMTQPLRMRNSLTELVSLGEDSTSIYAEVTIDVVQGAAREVRLQLHETVTVNQVSGAMVSDWQSNRRRVDCHVSRTHGAERQIHHQRGNASGPRRTTQYSAASTPELRTRYRRSCRRSSRWRRDQDLKSHGLEEANATDLGDTIASRQSPSLAAFRFRAGQPAATRELTVNVARYTQQAVLMANVEEARYHVLMSKASFRC